VNRGPHTASESSFLRGDLPFPTAARSALADSQLRRNLGHATATIRAKRAAVVAEVPDWQQLREAGSAIKADTMARLDALFGPEAVTGQRYGAQIYGRYGFVDAFNPSFTFADVKLTHGRVVPDFGWVDTDYLGIDQGPLLAMLGNYRGELVWQSMRANAHLKRGLQRAGFSGGWLDRPTTAAPSAQQPQRSASRQERPVTA